MIGFGFGSVRSFFFGLFVWRCLVNRQSLIVPTTEIGEELCIRVYSSFFLFVFHLKSGTTNNHWTGLSDISRASF